MKIFITGASGFIGRHLVKKLLKDGHEITINLYEDEINPFGEDVNAYNLGISNMQEAINFFNMNNFNGVIHLAALVQSQKHSSQDIDRLLDTNIKFATKVLEISVSANVQWFINTGTFWQNFQNAEYSPVNLYAATKQAFEIIAKYYIETEQIKFATLRLCDTYGPNDKRLKIFNLWKQIADTGETLDMTGGEQMIDISYIDDVISAFVLLAENLQNQKSVIPNGAIYAVKASKRYTLKQLAAIYEKVTHTKLNINWGAKPYREREVMIPWENGQSVPGWKPQVSIEEGIKKILLQSEYNR